MLKHIFIILFIISTFTLVTAKSWAHVPYFEHNDFSAKQPFTVEYSIEQSLAIYAWLENNDLGNSGDIDVFVFRINEPTNVYLEVIVPVCKGYRRPPRIISTADVMKITGHSLNGRKLILNPVRNETKAKTTRTTTELR